MITEDYVSYETAKLLKKSGFDSNEISCIRVFKGHTYKIQDTIIDADEDVTIPTIQMAMKWLRDNNGIAIIPTLSSILDNEKFLWDVKIVVAKTGESYSQGWIYETYERACEAAIRYSLKSLI